MCTMKSRLLKNQFRTDPSGAYCSLSELAKHNENNGRPVYKNKENVQQEKQFFDDVDEATGFWKELWEQKSTGSTSAKWLMEIKSAIHKGVTASTETEWLLDTG